MIAVRIAVHIAGKARIPLQTFASRRRRCCLGSFAVDSIAGTAASTGAQGKLAVDNAIEVGAAGTADLVGRIAASFDDQRGVRGRTALERHVGLAHCDLHVASFWNFDPPTASHFGGDTVGTQRVEIQVPFANGQLHFHAVIDDKEGSLLGQIKKLLPIGQTGFVYLEERCRRAAQRYAGGCAENRSSDGVLSAGHREFHFNACHTSHYESLA